MYVSIFSETGPIKGADSKATGKVEGAAVLKRGRVPHCVSDVRRIRRRTVTATQGVVFGLGGNMAVRH